MFLQNARWQGLNGLPNFLLSMAVCIGFYILTSVPMMLYSTVNKLTAEQVGTYTSPFAFGLTLLVFAGFIIGVVVATKAIHKRSALSVFTGKLKFSYRRVFQGIGIWLMVMTAIEIISYCADPDIYTMQFELMPFLGLLAVALLVLPIQTTAEELFFRGYLMQQIGLLSSYRWVPVLITSVLFGSLHLSNPEVAEYGLIKSMSLYIGLGLFFGIVTIMDDGLELPFGIHYINNFFAFVLVGYESSVFEGVPSVFIKSAEDLTYASVISNLAVMVLVLLAMQNIFKWPSFKILFERIKPQD